MSDCMFSAQLDVRLKNNCLHWLKLISWSNAEETVNRGFRLVLKSFQWLLFEIYNIQFIITNNFVVHLKLSRQMSSCMGLPPPSTSVLTFLFSQRMTFLNLSWDQQEVFVYIQPGASVYATLQFMCVSLTFLTLRRFILTGF